MIRKEELYIQKISSMHLIRFGVRKPLKKAWNAVCAVVFRFRNFRKTPTENIK